MTTTSAALAAAIECLYTGYTPVVDHDEETVTYYEDGTRAWYRVSIEDAEELGARILRGDRSPYSRWCADTMSEQVSDPSDC